MEIIEPVFQDLVNSGGITIPEFKQDLLQISHSLDPKEIGKTKSEVVTNEYSNKLKMVTNRIDQGLFNWENLPDFYMTPQERPFKQIKQTSYYQRTLRGENMFVWPRIYLLSGIRDMIWPCKPFRRDVSLQERTSLINNGVLELINDYLSSVPQFVDYLETSELIQTPLINALYIVYSDIWSKSHIKYTRPTGINREMRGYICLIRMFLLGFYFDPKTVFTLNDGETGSLYNNKSTIFVLAELFNHIYSVFPHLTRYLPVLEASHGDYISNIRELQNQYSMNNASMPTELPIYPYLNGSGVGLEPPLQQQQIELITPEQLNLMNDYQLNNIQGMRKRQDDLNEWLTERNDISVHLYEPDWGARPLIQQKFETVQGQLEGEKPDFTPELELDITRADPGFNPAMVGRGLNSEGGPGEFNKGIPYSSFVKFTPLVKPFARMIVPNTRFKNRYYWAVACQIANSYSIVLPKDQIIDPYNMYQEEILLDLARYPISDKVVYQVNTLIYMQSCWLNILHYLAYFIVGENIVFGLSKIELIFVLTRGYWKTLPEPLGTMRSDLLVNYDPLFETHISLKIKTEGYIRYEHDTLFWSDNFYKVFIPSRKLSKEDMKYYQFITMLDYRDYNILASISSALPIPTDSSGYTPALFKRWMLDNFPDYWLLSTLDKTTHLTDIGICRSSMGILPIIKNRLDYNKLLSREYLLTPENPYRYSNPLHISIGIRFPSLYNRYDDLDKSPYINIEGEKYQPTLIYRYEEYPITEYATLLTQAKVDDDKLLQDLIDILFQFLRMCPKYQYKDEMLRTIRTYLPAAKFEEEEYSV